MFPLWVVYGGPLTLLKWIWEGMGKGPVPPMVAFYGLRIVMFLLSFVLGDWAMHELLDRPRDRRVAILLLSSTYVTWTYQTHTFSNSIETLLVLWTVVLATRLQSQPERVAARSCFWLAFTVVLGSFNRITFPAFVVVPLLQLLPSCITRQPLRLLVLGSAAAFTIILAVAMDTDFYTGGDAPLRLRQLHSTAVITPWNNLAYNRDAANLAKHGLHPFWQHTIANLPQLLGPLLPLVITSCEKTSTPFLAAITGLAALSAFPHQEPRFLLPMVPLLAASIRLSPPGTASNSGTSTPSSTASPNPVSITAAAAAAARRRRNFRLRAWIAVWIFFNALAGILFGIYHQGGVVPAQAWIAAQLPGSSPSSYSSQSPSPPTLHPPLHVTWWKTYSPPRWILGTHGGDGPGANITTVDLMGAPGATLIEHLRPLAVPRCRNSGSSLFSSKPKATSLLVAPLSATFLDAYVQGEGAQVAPSAAAAEKIQLRELWRYRAHIGLDDLDFGNKERGVLGEVARVLGRRGIGVWAVERGEAC